MAEGMPPEFDDPGIDTTIANPARVYDVLLGGAHNFAADREAAARMLPTAAATARTNRAFLRRAVSFMLDEGITQFLDLGSGIPTVGNVHEIAQRANPDARVVYVDNEPVAVRHATTLLADNAGAGMVGADLSRVEDVLGAPETVRLLDLARPVGVLLAAVFHFIPDAADPAGILDRYTTRLAAGSYLALSHYTADAYTAEQREAASQAGATYQQGTRTPVVPRSRTEIAALLRDVELVPPGIVPTEQWRPDAVPLNTRADAPDIYAVVARVPA